MIFVRPDGSDEHGDGTLEEPYRTIQHAVLFVPNIIPAGTIYRIDATGLGDELFPENYSFPVFVGSESIGAIDFGQRFFHYYGSVNIQADPQLVAGIQNVILPGTQTINPAPSGDLSELISVTVTPSPGWPVGGLKGKFLIGAGTASEHSVIWDNTVDTIFLTRKMPGSGGFAPAPLTFPAQIMECSVHLHGPRDSGEIHEAAINMNNTQMALLGIRVSGDGDPTPTFPFPDWGLQVGGTTPPTTLQLCQLIVPGLTAESWVRVRQCYMEKTCFMTTPVLLTQCYLFQSAPLVVAPVSTTFWNTRGLGGNLIRQCVLDNMQTLNFRDVFDLFGFELVPSLVIQDTKILDPQPDFAIGFRNEAIIWAGSQLRLINVDIRRTTAAPGGPTDNPLTIIQGNGNSAQVTLTSVGPAAVDSNFGNVGVLNQDGGHVFRNDGIGAATTLAGTAGAYQTGSIAPVGAWPVGTFSELDVAGPAPEGSRTSGV